MPLTAPTKYTFKPQAWITQTRAPPVLNVWYTLLDAIGGTLLRQAYFSQINDLAAAADIEVRLTMDGIAQIAAITADSGTSYWLYLTSDDEPGLAISTQAAGNRIALTSSSAEGLLAVESLEGRNIKVEYRQVSALGTTPILNGSCAHSLLRDR